jgi:hypothetical protein
MREKLIELLEQSLSHDGTGREMRFTGSDVTPCLIANGVTVQEWISVKDRLPDEDEDVLAFGYYHETFQTLICHYRSDFKGQWFTSVAGQQVYEVTHWMPLPQPPKGE